MIGKFGIRGQPEVGVHGLERQAEARRGVAQIDEAVRRPARRRNVPEDFDRNLGHGDVVVVHLAGMRDDQNFVRLAHVCDLLGDGDAERNADGQVRYCAFGERALSDRIASPKRVGSTSLSLPAFGLGTAHLGELYGKVAEADSDATAEIGKRMDSKATVAAKHTYLLMFLR